jgi:3-oxoacyl-(acyl-carrier-protein) synthase
MTARLSYAITASGLITSAGDTPGALFAALVEGAPRAALEPSPGGSGGPHRPLALAPIAGFDPKVYIKRKGLKDLSRTSQLTCAAASRIAQDLQGIPGRSVGVVLGSAWGCLRTVVEFEGAAARDGPRFVDPLLFTETVANVPAGQVSIFHGWSAFNVTVSAGTASGIEAIRRAIDLLAEGRAEIAVAGGADEIGLPILRALDGEDAVAGDVGSLPFAAGRSGPVGGEGACLVAIETPEHARAGGRDPFALVLAAASRCSMREPSTPAAARVEAHVRGLLDTARLAPGAIDLIVLSAGGRPARDAAEAQAIRAVFGAGEGAPPVLAPKAVLGETWGASGTIAVVVAMQAMREGRVPAWPSSARRDPEAAGIHLPSRPLARPIRRALVLDCAGQGHVAGLVLSTGEAHERS